MQKKQETFPVVFNGETFKIQPHGVAVFQVQTDKNGASRVELGELVKIYKKIDQKLRKRKSCAIFVPKEIHFEGYHTLEYIDDMIKNLQDLKNEFLTKEKEENKEVKLC